MSKKPPTAVTATKVELDRPIKSQQTIEALFTQYQKAFQRVAAEGLDVGRMMQVAIMTMSRSQDLLDCTAISLLGAFMLSAQMGLDLAVKEAYLVAFRNKYTKQREVQLIPDYRGLIKLARNTGQIKDLWARLVYSGEKFNAIEGDSPRLDHTPNYKIDRKPANIVAAYSIATWEDNRMTFEVITRDKIERARKASASTEGPWSTDYDEMALKTAIKHRCKTLPRSAKLITAMALDERAELGKPQSIELISDGDMTLAQMGPEAPDTAPGDDRQDGSILLVSGTQQGKILTWIKQYKWTETETRQMLKRLQPDIDVTVATLQEVICQIPDKVFDNVIDTLEKGQNAARAAEAQAQPAQPQEAPARKNERDPDSPISEDEYKDLWSLAVENEKTSEAKKFAKSLGYDGLRAVKAKDLSKIIDYIRKK